MCRRKTICALLILLLLTGCAKTQKGETQLLTDAAAPEHTVSLAQVQYGDVRKDAPGFVNAQAFYERDEQLTCEQVAGLVLNECYVKHGDRVEEGQILAKFVRLPDETEKGSLEQTLKAVKLGFEAESAKALGAVAEAQAALDATAAGTAAARTAQLRLERAQTAAEKLDDSEVRRAQAALDRYNAQVAGVEFTAPFAGTVDQLMRINGQAVSADSVFCRLYTEDAGYVVAFGVNEVGYHVGARVRIRISNEDFCEGTVLSSAEAYGVVNAAVIVRPDPDANLTELVESMVSPTIVVSRVLLRNVLRLPKSSVRNEEGRYYVYLSEDGQMHRRDVQIGLDGIDPATGAGYVQIVDGLNEGDMVQLR